MVSKVSCETPFIGPMSIAWYAAVIFQRGWTTWSLAATDQRVIAAAPMVFSLLNFNEVRHAHA